jgi:hypothetical protein
MLRQFLKSLIDLDFQNQPNFFKEASFDWGIYDSFLLTLSHHFMKIVADTGRLIYALLSKTDLLFFVTALQPFIRYRNNANIHRPVIFR